MGNKRLVMLIDINRCIGCHACAVACKANNNLPNEIWWNQVLTHGGKSMDTPRGQYPNLQLQFLPLACQHCDNPPCVKACPTGATYQADNGIVMMDYDKCVGCGSCILACPYKYVRQFNEKEPQYMLDFPTGNEGVPAQQKGTVSKCTFCHTLVAKGETPACIEVCPVNARYFGDLTDKESTVFKVLQENQHLQLLTERGTNPSVYYLTGRKPQDGHKQ
ncbi:MAG TPA: 4Fe-4S dicluster domain-containing protein [Syntrophomonas sp.]|jgi:molybdopterin-containing oxidoreductase family iron-sulfur binding subunit|nr:4Fe-4S dicluster domain-containing protein [Syntrophomonas sp.]